MYAILRVGKKYKTINEITGFRKHMEREIETLNSNGNANHLIIGDRDLRKAEGNLSKLKKRVNSVLAREILLTASPEFFKNLSEEDLYKWIDANKKFLDINFKEVVYANAHMDEKSPHIHALVIPLSDRGTLSNSYYFNGKQKLTEWQDKYAEEIKKYFPQLQRGTKYSKASHIDIKKFYTLIQQPVSKDLEVLEAKARYSELLEIQLKAMEKTLAAYKRQNETLQKENTKLSLELDNTRHKASFWEKVSNYISLVYKVPQKRFNEILDYVSGREKGE